MARLGRLQYHRLFDVAGVEARIRRWRVAIFVVTGWREEVTESLMHLL